MAPIPTLHHPPPLHRLPIPKPPFNFPILGQAHLVILWEHYIKSVVQASFRKDDDIQHKRIPIMESSPKLMDCFKTSLVNQGVATSMMDAYLSALEQQEAEAMERLAREQLQHELSPEMKEELRALGYLN